VNQLCPRTAEQLESSGVMKKVMECISLVRNQSQRSIDLWMSELDNPLKSRNGIGQMSQVWRLCFEMKFESKKQCMDLELMRVMMSEFGIRSEVSRSVRELGPERADVLSLNSASALMVSTQSSVGAELRGLLNDFLTPRWFLHWRSFHQRSSCPWMYLLP